MEVQCSTTASTIFTKTYGFMTRDEILQEVSAIPNTNKLLMLSTGVGKTKIAIELTNQIKPSGKILVVIPRLVLIQNWKDEFIKWGYEKYLPQVEFITYVSLPKKAGSQYDMVIYDEVHHLSDRCQSAIPYIKSKYNILLSATIKRTLKPNLDKLFPNLYTYKISLQQAVENDILPEPRIILIPLELETVKNTEIYQLKPKAKTRRTITYQQWLKGKWSYLKNKTISYGVDVICTQKQKNTEFNDYIDNCTKRLRSGALTGMSRVYTEQARKQTGLKRLQWLAEIKSDFVKQLLKQLKNYRTLTFCYSIDQTERLGKYCINSKNAESAKYLDSFNNKKIKHITSVNMLNEGVNLTDCKCGIFAVYNTSLVMRVQKVGRLLRHKTPVIYLPYYKNTKEESIVIDMVEGYDKSLITIVSNPFNFNAYINR